MSKVPEPVHGRARPGVWELAVHRTPSKPQCACVTTRPFIAPGPSCSRLEDSGRGVGRATAEAPLSSLPQWLHGWLKPGGCVRGQGGLIRPPGPPGSPSTPGLAAAASETIQGPGPEHHLSALHGGGGLVSMATVQCEGILASLGSALSSINRGCSRLHAYYEQSRALSTGNYA